MNFLSRAWQFTIAKKGRTGVLILVFSAILVFVMAGLTIQSATQKASKNTKDAIGATVTLGVNREKVMGNDPKQFSQTEMPTMTASQVEAISKLPEVKNTVITTRSSASGTDSFTALKSGDEDDDEDEDNPGGGRGNFMVSVGDGKNMMDVDLQVTGINNMAYISTFSDGTNTITEGRGITEEDKGTNNVVVEETLIKLNDLKLGDTIKVKDGDEKEIELKIVGIYKSGEEVNDMASRVPSMNPVNCLYTYYTEANVLAGKEEDVVSNATFNLKEPEEMDNFVKKAEKKIDTEKFQLTTNDTLYQQMLGPVNNVSSFSKNIVFLVAIAGAIILTLIVILQIRERKFEIGVLMSLGENKGKVIGQFLAELLIVMLVSAGLAGVFGNAVGNVVGQQLLTQQNAAAEEEEQNNPFGGGGPSGGGPTMVKDAGGVGMRARNMMNPFSNNSDVKKIDELQVKTTPKTFGLLIAIAMGITVVAILLASIGILRMQPKAILTSN